jgi:hypothetical protein
MLLLPGMEREKSFMNERIYEDKSLKELIGDLSDPRILITDEKIINLVVKYFYAYRFPESISERVKLQDIEYIFDQAHRYFRLHREKRGKNVRLNPWDDAREFTFFQNHIYATSMLWDIAATTIIVKQIIKSIVKRENFDDSFVGLDLWSGSWILTLASTISAVRNDFWNILCIGCEIENTSMVQSRKLLNDIFSKRIIIGRFDTTSESDIGQLLDKKSGKKFALITNENITTTWVAMGNWPDPFHQNNLVLFRTLAPMISQYTIFFPHKIKMLLDLSEAMKKEIEGTKENAFGSILLSQFWESIKRDMPNLPDNWNILHHVFPLWIDINGEMLPLHEIGDDLYDKWLLRYLPDWRHRWSDKSVS